MDKDIIGISLILIGFIIFIISLIFLSKVKEIKDNKIEQIKAEEQKLLQEKNKSQEELIELQNKLNDFRLTEKDKVKEEIQEYRDSLTSENNFYKENLVKEYESSKNEYSNKIREIQLQYEQESRNLENIKNKLKAATEAEAKEKMSREEKSKYCIQISDADKADIMKLESIKPTLAKPRVLSMLIWQTWFQKPLKTLSTSLLGVKTVTGIYKITNLETGMCYIGQAIDVATRWSQHAKCGLGIDTPANNKLYEAMKEYGLWSFSWELLKECPKEELNEQEKYYIDLYSSYDYGMNQTRGNN